MGTIAVAMPISLPNTYNISILCVCFSKTISGYKYLCDPNPFYIIDEWQYKHFGFCYNRNRKVIKVGFIDGYAMYINMYMDCVRCAALCVIASAVNMPTYVPRRYGPDWRWRQQQQPFATFTSRHFCGTKCALCLLYHCGVFRRLPSQAIWHIFSSHHLHLLLHGVCVCTITLSNTSWFYLLVLLAMWGVVGRAASIHYIRTPATHV